MNKRGMILTLCTALFFLQGCFEKEVPKCSDERVGDVVKQLYSEKAGKASKDNMLLMLMTAMTPKEISKLEMARSVRYDEKILLRSCKAKAVFDNNQSADIEYTVQIIEGKEDEFLVELDLKFIETLVQQGLMQNIWKDMK